MRALVVIAHPSPRSLTAALARVACSALAEAGYTVETSDLYAMGWDPALRLKDYGEAADDVVGTADRRAVAGGGKVADDGAARGRAVVPGRTVTLLSKHAYEAGELAPEIVAEQDKVRRADLLVLLFPMWWHGMPAILKGWFDRVFLNGFAFGLKNEAGVPRKYGDGGLAGRRVLAVITAGDRGSSFGPRGLNGDLEELFFPFLHGTAWYTGMQPLRPHLVSGVDRPDWDLFDDEVRRLRDRIAGLGAEEPMRYRALSDGDYGRDRELRADVLPGQSGLSIHEERCVDRHRLAS